jgi:hypothetical protein
MRSRTLLQLLGIGLSLIIDSLREIGKEKIKTRKKIGDNTEGIDPSISKRFKHEYPANTLPILIKDWTGPAESGCLERD